MSERILVTGAAGRIGAQLRPRLAKPGRVLRLMDIAPIPPAAEGEQVELVTGSITDLAAMCTASKDVDAVIHLGGIPGEDSWRNILETNIHGTYTVLEAARRTGVRRVILASSNHAVGFQPLDGGQVPDDLYPKPDTYYGVSKAANEALGSLYHDRYGLDVIAIRIGACYDRPRDGRDLTVWLSPDDCARLFEAAISVPDPGFRLVWGASANTRGIFSLAAAREIGYQPQDDAEVYAGSVEPLTELGRRFVGGKFCSPDLDAEVTP